MMRAGTRVLQCAVMLLVLGVVWSGHGLAGEVVLPAHGLVQELKPLTSVRPFVDGESIQPTEIRAGTGFAPFDPALDRAAGPVWLRLGVQSQEGGGGHVLRVSRRFFSRFDLEVHAPDGLVHSARLSSGRVQGARIVGRDYVVDLPVQGAGTTWLLILVETAQGGLSPLSMSIEDSEGFARRESRSLLLLGLVVGIIIGLVFHNAALYLSLRRRGHLLYVFAMTALVLLLGIDSGLLQRFVLPDAWLAYEPRLYVALMVLMLVSISLFFQAFVDSRRHLPRIDRWIVRMRWPLAAAGVLTPLLPAAAFPIGAMGVQVLSSVMLVLMLVAALVASRRGIFEGHVFLAAWATLVASNVVRTLLTLDVLGSNWMLEHLFYIGALLEAVILAMGLAWRVHELRRGHEDAVRKQVASARLANLDPLTGAFNRRLLMQELVQLTGGGGGGRAGLVMLDVDGFKAVNDQLGHVAGDEVLCELVRRIRTVLRQEDLLCRLGGDEFVIVLRAPRGRDAADVGARIRSTVAGAPFEVHGVRLAITASIGVVPDLGAIGDATGALRNADQALYRAKREGRDRVVVQTG